MQIAFSFVKCKYILSPMFILEYFMKKLLLVMLFAFVATNSYSLGINDRLAPLDPGDGDGSEYSVQEILDQVTGGTIDAVDDQSKVALWRPSDFGQHAFKVTYLTGVTRSFGIYSDTTGQMVDLISKTSSVYDDWSSGTFTAPASASFFFWNDDLYVNGSPVGAGFGDTFGFYWGAGKTEDDQNVGGAIYALTYQLPEGTDVILPAAPSGTTDDDNDWLMFFGDQGSLAGDDFNDFAVLVQDIAPVPEPGTLLLLGSGLIGLAYYKRRKS
jgi:hypothetical protein